VTDTSIVADHEDKHSQLLSNNSKHLATVVRVVKAHLRPGTPSLYAWLWLAAGASGWYEGERGELNINSERISAAAAVGWYDRFVD